MFKQPKVMKITGRTSSITNAFVNGIMPVIEPKPDQEKEALDILGMSYDNMFCAYCGGTYETWDHFEPLVINKKPTGYISEIYNLIPSCNTCNSSKGSKNWRVWVESSSKKSLKSRGKYNKDLITKISDYEIWCMQHRNHIKSEDLVKLPAWLNHWGNHDAILEEMRRAQEDSDNLKNEILNHFMKERT